MWDEAVLWRASKALQAADLTVGDFRTSASVIQAGDFVFFDPPYPKGSVERIGFNRYAMNFFGEDDHRDLAETIVRISKKGAMVMATVANLTWLDALYPSTLRRTCVASKSLIACNGDARRKVSELILTNF
jgi:DNA adenine methylase